MAGIILPQRYLDITVRLGRRVTFAASRARVQMLVEVRPIASSRLGPPVDLRFVVDRSESMTRAASARDKGSKLDLAKAALLALADKLSAKDRVMLASFNEEASRNVGHDHAGFFRRRAFRSAVRGLTGSGYTHISGALELGLAPSLRQGEVARVVLLTDGQSTHEVPRDHETLVALADQSRNDGIPLCIYGTGPDYNWTLLQLLAARAGGGSFCAHVMDFAALEGHLLGEVANLRGTAVHRLRVRGRAAPGTSIVSVYALVPLLRRLEPRDPDRHGADYAQEDKFRDSSGSLDVARGQAYLIEVEVEHPRPGECPLLELTFSGEVLRTGVSIKEKVSLEASFTPDRAKEDPLDPRVEKFILEVAAAEQAKRGHYARSSELYAQAGNRPASQEMRTMDLSSRQGGVTEEMRRGAFTEVSCALTRELTIDLDPAASSLGSDGRKR